LGRKRVDVAVAVNRFEDFQEHYERAAPGGGLFAFFLYSNRNSQRHVAQFAASQFGFFNELASQQNMYCYIFKLGRTNVLQNPSAEISRIFKIPASSLPGLLVFAAAPSIGRAKGIFFPIPATLFREREKIEDRLARLFDAIGEAQGGSSSEEEAIILLTRTLPKWRRTDFWRPILGYATRQSQRLVNLPSDLVKKMAEGYARGLISSAQ